ncbi:MAG: sodium:solute symporter family protein [Acidobacteriota bacterium]
MILAILLSYLMLVALIGPLSNRLLRATGEDYFVATRSIGPVFLLLSLFGTNMTAFTILGASGEAYRVGIGVFALMASSSALVIPCVFLFIGTRLWAVGKRTGILTQVQYVRRRWANDGLGSALFPVLVLLLMPYLLIGLKGGGVTLNRITGGQVPAWVGGLLITMVVFSYVSFGGLRGTTWANAFQTTVFMVLGAITLGYIVHRLGGLGAALDQVEAARPELLRRTQTIPPLKQMTYPLVAAAVGTFPHIFLHWMSARRVETFRLPILAYPLCIAAVWLPSVLLGVLGHVNFPNLTSQEAGGVLIRMIHFHAPEALAGLLGAGVFAAVMSSLDSQVLALGTMFTKDVLQHRGWLRSTGDAARDEQRQIWAGRAFVGAILLITYALSLIVDSTIFGLAIWSFTGFTGLLPILVAGVWWRRSTAAGVGAALATTVTLWLAFFLHGGSVPGYTVGGTGLMPVAIVAGASAIVLVLVSLATRPPSDDVLAPFFPDAASEASTP